MAEGGKRRKEGEDLLGRGGQGGLPFPLSAAEEGLTLPQVEDIPFFTETKK